MENERYNSLIKNNQLDLLSKIDNTRDLVNYKYNNRYLIEYLLENNIHSNNMDNIVVYSDKMASFYMKYNIIKPLFNCHLTTLLNMDTINDKLLLDELLEKINHQERMIVYQNIKSNSYWSYHDNEDYVIKVFEKYNISLPKLFLTKTSYIDKDLNNTKMLQTAIEEFKVTYQDHNENIIYIVLSELSNNSKQNIKIIISEINALINYKKSNPNFKFILSNTSDGSYDKEHEIMKISQFRKEVLSHELSHLLYENDEKYSSIDIVDEYEAICQDIDNEESINKIVNYLKDFHNRYNEMQKIFEELYYYNIRKKYHSYEEYINLICNDIKKSNPEFISLNYGVETGYYVSDENIIDITSELLLIEKKEFIKNELSNYYSEELMLENILDAILHGRLLDDLLNIKCLSGHSFFQFNSDYTLSFNESLANYYTIKKSNKAGKLIGDLRMIVGNDLVDLFDEYLRINRGSYGY